MLDDDQRRDAVKFIMGLGVGPSLSRKQQLQLSMAMYFNGTLPPNQVTGVTKKEALAMLRDLGWID